MKNHKAFYCQYCDENLIPDEFGIYVHYDKYHLDNHVYDTAEGTQHVVPVGRLNLRN